MTKLPALALSRLAPDAVPSRRKNWALFVAGVSDLTQVLFLPVFAEGAASPFEVALDSVTAVLIMLIVGFKWRLAVALAAELVPGVDLFPTWTAMVLSLPVQAKELEAHTEQATELHGYKTT
jgi:hypothetical protein